MFSPVRPRADPSSSSKDGASQPSEEVRDRETAQQEEEEANLEHAISTKDVIPGAEQQESPLATPLPTPPTMTAAERAQHNLHHLPPHRGCPICAANRTPNTAHFQSHEHERTIPLLVGDYCFLRSIIDKPLITCLVMRLYPYRICFRYSCPTQRS